MSDEMDNQEELERWAELHHIRSFVDNVMLARRQFEPLTATNEIIGALCKSIVSYSEAVGSIFGLAQHTMKSLETMGFVIRHKDETSAMGVPLEFKTMRVGKTVLRDE